MDDATAAATAAGKTKPMKHGYNGVIMAQGLALEVVDGVAQKGDKKLLVYTDGTVTLPNGTIVGTLLPPVLQRLDGLKLPLEPKVKA